LREQRIIIDLEKGNLLRQADDECYSLNLMQEDIMGQEYSERMSSS